jgi:CRP/FNR family transcriptional regulator, cyclic AMP receptor protein
MIPADQGVRAASPGPRSRVEGDDARPGSPHAGLAALRRAPMLAGVEPDILAGLAARARWLNYEGGEVVIDFGDATDEVFFIIDGALRVILRTALGHEAILNELGAGEIFGELAAIDGQPRSANVTALRRTSLCAVPAAAFLELALNAPVVGHRLLRLLAARLRAKDERLLEYAALTARQRLISELLRLSRDRGAGERVLSPPPSQGVLAARINTRRETVSRELARMARAGLISVGRRAIVLHKPETLTREIRTHVCDDGSITTRTQR